MDPKIAAVRHAPSSSVGPEFICECSSRQLRREVQSGQLLPMIVL
ncbi:hypothetical protein RESH_00636 [Rhodopirellula europaea SH398]|uniref:Uncharacterized protein n=1 Tax=Rhodopirellula europaea SH398 TaxID=1263868 RepID=M5SRB2_9BACT|nr:hypothetical protein RESH_00636 [Rhodopirellula europaea SH398]